MMFDTYEERSGNSADPNKESPEWQKGVEMTMKMFDKREFREEMIKSPCFISKNKDKQYINWLDDAEEHDYPAAAEFLSLFFDDATVARVIEL